MPRRALRQDICVIGTRCASIDRTWFTNEAAAIEHAKTLMANKQAARQPTKRLLVVRVCKVVELNPPVPPPVEVRDPREGDTDAD